MSLMRPLVTIAISDLAGESALCVTLAALARHTPESHTIVLLAEETLNPQRLEHSGVPLRRIVVSAPFAVPTALNRLLEETSSPYLLFLESGAIVTAGWLNRLLAPLADPTIGLSGPSTNVAWNEQQVLPRAGGYHWSADQIDEFARSLAARYQDQRVPLDTLHSLCEFCYLYKRAVAEQIGGFDKAYADGPCWEMDFNIRAARAGFRGVWVPAAYVHRSPTPRVKVDALRRLFVRNKQLYQDRFCGLRLRGEKKDYEPHCRGEACEHFAPRELIQVKLEHSFVVPKRVAGVPHESCIPRSVDDAPSPSELTRAQVTSPRSEALPLISCIMVTRNRRAFVRQAIAYFQRQEYMNRELVILDDGDDKISDLVPEDPRIRYTSLPRAVSIGAKRNLACEMAKGKILAHWDDDDWHGARRLSHQIAPLLSGATDITGLETACFFDLERWEAWVCTPELHGRLFVGDVHGGTLVYWRSVWEKLSRYPDRSLAEDALFLRQACRQGARLHKLPADGTFVYLRHGSNAWRFSPGTYLDPAGWKRVDPDAFIPAPDRAFYAALSPALQQREWTSSATGDAPLVSCIMPTFNRRAFVPLAIRYFLRQDYANRELIILDDGEDCIADLVPADSRIRYFRLDARKVLGVKRNLACELARGSIIAHWDDDDWIAPHRLRYQVEMLTNHHVDLCGAARQLYYDPVADKAWLYEYPDVRRRWLAGNTLCYLKTFWQRNPFPEIQVGEDTRFAWSSLATNALAVPDYDFYVGLIHASNTSRKVVTGPYWHPCPSDKVYSLLGSDLAAIRQRIVDL